MTITIPEINLDLILNNFVMFIKVWCMFCVIIMIIKAMCLFYDLAHLGVDIFENHKGSVFGKIVFVCYPFGLYRWYIEASKTNNHILNIALILMTVITFMVFIAIINCVSKED